MVTVLVMLVIVMMITMVYKILKMFSHLTQVKAKTVIMMVLETMLILMMTMMVRFKMTRFSLMQSQIRMALTMRPSRSPRFSIKTVTVR